MHDKTDALLTLLPLVKLKVSATLFEALRERLVKERRRVFSSWYAQQAWAEATRLLPPEARRWQNAPDSNAVSRTLARLRAEGRVSAIEEYPSVYVLEDPSFSSNSPTAHELLSALHPDAVLSYESALRVHQLTLRFSNQIHCSWDPTDTFRSAETHFPSAFHTTAPRQLPSSLSEQPVSWHRESPQRLATSELLDVEGVWMLVASIERTLVDGLARPQWCGGPAVVFQAWADAMDFLDPEAVEAYASLIDSKVLYQRTGFVLEALGYNSPTLDSWAQNATPGGSAILVSGLPWTGERDERWKLGVNFYHGLET